MIEYDNDVRKVAGFFLYKEGYPEEECLIAAQRFFDAAQELLDFLYPMTHTDMRDEEIQAQIYEIGKKHYGTERQILRLWFADIYFMMTCGRDRSGPRLGVYVNLLTPYGFASILDQRIQNPFMY